MNKNIKNIFLLAFSFIFPTLCLVFYRNYGFEKTLIGLSALIYLAIINLLFHIIEAKKEKTNKAWLEYLSDLLYRLQQYRESNKCSYVFVIHSEENLNKVCKVLISEKHSFLYKAIGFDHYQITVSFPARTL